MRAKKWKISLDTAENEVPRFGLTNPLLGPASSGADRPRERPSLERPMPEGFVAPRERAHRDVP